MKKVMLVFGTRPEAIIYLKELVDETLDGDYLM